MSPGEGPATIRRANPADWQRYRDVRLRALREDPLAFGSTFAGETSLPESVWRGRLGEGRPEESSATWVSVDRSGSFLGLLSAVEVEGSFHLFSMWVAPEVRRRGIGARMLDRALAWITSTSPRAEVILDVNPERLAAVRLYESRGFRATGRTESLGHTPPHSLREMKRQAPR